MTTPATLLAEAVEAACDVNHSLAYRPSRPDAKMAFVAPDEVWKQVDEDRYCGISIGLTVWLVAGSADQRESLTWLDEQSSILMLLDPIDVGDDTVIAGPVDAPVLLSSPGDGSTFLACQVRYSRFSTGD